MPFPIDLQKNMARTQCLVKNSDFFTNGLILVIHIIYQLLVMIWKQLHHLKHPNPGPPVTVMDIVTHSDFLFTERFNRATVKTMFCEIYTKVIQNSNSLDSVLEKAKYFSNTMVKSKKKKESWKQCLDKNQEGFMRAVISDSEFAPRPPSRSLCDQVLHSSYMQQCSSQIFSGP